MPKFKMPDNPSEKVAFTKGQVIVLTGPAWFPFHIEARVYSDSKRIGSLTGATHTRIEITGTERPLKRPIIQHWADSEDFNLILPELHAPTGRYYEMCEDEGLPCSITVKK